MPVDEGKVNTDRAKDYFPIRKAYFELSIKEREEQKEDNGLRRELTPDTMPLLPNGAVSTRTTTRSLSCLTASVWKSLQ